MLTILVADDEFAVLDVLSTALEAEGYRVLRAGDGADALRILASTTVDLVVADEIMPHMGGVQLASALRADGRLVSTPVILMVDAFRRSGAVESDIEIVPKPILVPQLLAHVAAASARKQNAP